MVTSHRLITALLVGLCTVTAGGAQPTMTAPAAGAALQPPAGVTFHPDLTYAKTAKGALQLDLACPAASDGPCPLVLVLHGTGMSKGRKGNVPLTFRLAKHGYAAAAVSFRHTAADPYPRALDDVHAALRWLRGSASRYRLDADRVAALGYSGGGTLACLLGMLEDERPAPGTAPAGRNVQAVVAYYPPTDLARLHTDCSGTNGGLVHAYIRASLEQWLGGTPQTIGTRYAAVSPLTHVHARMAPTLLLHGSADSIVPVTHSQRLADRAAEKGANVSFLRLPGAPHCFDDRNDANAAMALQLVETFLEQHLRRRDGTLAAR